MKKILVVRFKQIGDAILSSVICSALKETYPDSEIDYVVYDYVAPLFFNQPHIDNVISISEEERKNPLKYIKKVWNVTRKKYDIVIDIMSTPKSEVFTLFSMGAEFRIGREKKWRGYTYTHSIPEPSDELDKREKFLEMLRPLEKTGVKVSFNSNYYLKISEEEKNTLRERMKECGVDFNKIIFAFAINSRRAGKIYPLDLMMEVIKKCLKEYDCEIIFYYSPSEKEYAKKTHELLGNDSRIFTNIETDSIRELAALLCNCDMFIGNEGGPRHLSEALGTPSFSIFNPGANKKNWLTKGSKCHKAIEFNDLDMDGTNMTYEEKYRAIKPEMILAGVRDIMENCVLPNKKMER
ncbi:glycosyltransferase family 9 protein [Cetobacterium sp. SF1]|uniref:glycosyltransferase family 9 protein n=1 Tax=Cetobacterium sp. SF1 TaxID=3417654 RepID=UPI003CF75C57